MFIIYINNKIKLYKRKQPNCNSCAVILVGKNLAYNGSIMITRTEDVPSGFFWEKVMIKPSAQPNHQNQLVKNLK